MRDNRCWTTNDGKAQPDFGQRPIYLTYFVDSQH